MRASRRGEAFAGTPLVAVTALLATSAVLSPQFVLWLLPVVAVLPANRAGERTRRLALAASVCTALMIFVMEPIRLGDHAAVALVLVRNLLLVGLVGSAWKALRHAPESQECSNDPRQAAFRTPPAPISSRTPTGG
jgi:hypothetical protein